MKRWRHGIAQVVLSALVLWSCDGSKTSPRQDAAPDAAEAGGDRVPADAAAPDVPGGSPDSTVSTDARDGIVVSPDTAFEVTRATDLAADAAGTSSADGAEVAAVAADAMNDQRDDAPASAEVAADTNDGAGPDRNADVADAPLDANRDDANTFRVVVSPNRALDLIFAVDNSPSMAPKQAKLKAQLPKLIDALRDPGDGTLPDLRLALIDSDLGTGGAYANGSCGPKYGVDGGAANFGDQGRFQMIGAAGCGVTDPNAAWLEHKQGQPLNYTGDIGSVFACLAGNLGTMGCGEEHTLQAFEFALVASGVGNDVQRAMLRPNAYLGLIFVTDEEDCSAAPDDGLFGDKPEVRGEAASLRCSTRAHACGGVNLTNVPPGYPTAASFSAPLASCAARTDDCPSPLDGTAGTDTSVPTACSPLRGVKRMADEMKALKARPEEQILVAGIFGWPLDEAALAQATYTIAPVPNPNMADTQHPTVFDVWPICYDPNHLPAAVDGGTGFDSVAAGWGGTPGLRLGAFVDQFGDNGLKFSICQPDFSAAMAKIGATLAKKSANLCVPARSDGYQGCTATYLIPDSGGNLHRESAMPLCNGSQTNRPCYALTADSSRCSASDRVVNVLEPVGASIDGGALPAGTLLEFACE